MEANETGPRPPGNRPVVFVAGVAIFVLGFVALRCSAPDGRDAAGTAASALIVGGIITIAVGLLRRDRRPGKETSRD